MGMAGPEQQPQRRQFVNFAFYKADPAWRRLPESERTQGKQEFIRAVEDYAGKVMVIPYSTVGIRGDCDFMLWRISYAVFCLKKKKVIADAGDPRNTNNLAVGTGVGPDGLACPGPLAAPPR